MNTTKVISGDLISLAQLMPINCNEQSDAKTVNTQLAHYMGFVKLTQTAVGNFLEGYFPDPLVGENACQIRTAMFCEMAQNQEIVIELNKLALTLQEMGARNENIEFKDKKRVSLMEVLEVHHLNVRIPRLVGPILFGHILTVTKLSDLKIENKDVVIKEMIKQEKLIGFSANFAQKLIKESRKAMSLDSIDYLRREVQLLPASTSKDNLTSLLHSDHVASDPLGLHSFPCLQGMQVLLGSMKVHKTAIVIKDRMFDIAHNEMGTATLLFEPRGIDGAYEFTDDMTQVDQDQPGMIIEAVSISDQFHDRVKLISSLVEMGVEKIILANSAAHTQYGGSMKEKAPPPSQEREALKEHAFKSGLCADSPEMCRIYHIYAGTLKRHLDLILSTYVFPGADEFVKQQAETACEKVCV